MSGIMWNIMIGVNSREVDLYEQIELIKGQPQNENSEGAPKMWVI